MNITKEQLIEMIEEELAMLEAPEGEEVMAAIKDVPDAAKELAKKYREEIEELAEPSGLDPLVLAQAVAALLTAKN